VGASTLTPSPSSSWVFFVLREEEEEGGRVTDGNSRRHEIFFENVAFL
jgi:hypothetical protein